jgi:hypothetical protein
MLASLAPEGKDATCTSAPFVREVSSDPEPPLQDRTIVDDCHWLEAHPSIAVVVVVVVVVAVVVVVVVVAAAAHVTVWLPSHCGVSDAPHSV